MAKVKRQINPAPEIDYFQRLCEAELGIMPIREYKFCSWRKWRADYAFIADSILIEKEGIGLHNFGRHQRYAGYVNDLAKYNTAQLLGYRVLRYTTKQIEQGIPLADIRKLMEGK